MLGHDLQTYLTFYTVTDDDGAPAASADAGKLFEAAEVLRRTKAANAPFQHF